MKTMLFTKSLTTLLARVSGAGFVFILYVVYARVLKLEEFGCFTLSLTLISILSMVSRWGLDQVLLKRVSALSSFDDNRARGYIKSVLYIVTGFSVISILILYAISPFVSSLFSKSEVFSYALKIMALAILPLSLNVVMGEVFNAYGRPLLATATHSIIAPVATMVIIGAGYHMGFINNNFMLTSYVLGMAIASIFGGWMLASLVPQVQPENVPLAGLLSQGWQLLLLASGALLLSWTDVLVLGYFSDEETVGSYAAAARLVLVTSLVLVAVNSITAPKYAKLWASRDIEEIKKLAQVSSFVSLLFVLLPALLLLLWPDLFMGIYGDEFISSSSLLVVLMIGQLVNVGCGSVGYLLVMTGRQIIMRNIMLGVAVLNIALSIIFFHLFGVIGVAYATALSVAAWNILAVLMVKIKLGFWNIPAYHHGVSL